MSLIRHVSITVAFDFFESFRLQDLVERLPLMPIIFKKLISIHYMQSLAAVMKIAKFILHSIYILKGNSNLTLQVNLLTYKIKYCLIIFKFI